jgi:hypothetical protein
MMRRRGVALCCSATLAGAFLQAPVARAGFDPPSEVILGTAQTLEQGEIVIGVLSPLAYGINDSLTVFIHPVSWALLAPNGSFRFRVYDEEPVRIAAVFGGAVAVTPDGVSVEDIRRPAGHIDVGVASTLTVGPWLLTGKVGYQRDFGPDDDDFDWSFVIDWVIGPSSLLQLQGGFQFGRIYAVKGVNASLSYVHSWGALHLAAGLAYGDFPLELEAGVVSACPNSWDYPCIWPVIDVFWRF